MGIYQIICNGLSLKIIFFDKITVCYFGRDGVYLMSKCNFSPRAFFNCQFIMLALIMFMFLFSPRLCLAYSEIDLKDGKALFDPPKIRVKGNVVYFDGKIKENSYTELLRKVGENKIKKISINSVGGDAKSALQIGFYVYHNDIDIDVRSVCASACANYIFPAGKQKHLGNDSYLLWHGGVNGPEKELNVSGGISRDDFLKLPEIKEIRKEDVVFYKKIGVAIQLSFCPQLKDDYNEKFPEKWFSYTPEDMGKFGMRNISYANSASQWVNSMRKKHVIFASYCN